MGQFKFSRPIELPFAARRVSRQRNVAALADRRNRLPGDLHLDRLIPTLTDSEGRYYWRKQPSETDDGVDFIPSSGI